MAKFKRDPNAPSAEDKAMNVFAEMMIEKIESVSKNWEKPWFTKGAMQWPKNLDGHRYNGMNAIFLMWQQGKMGWNSNRYATFEKIRSLNYDKDRNPLLDKEGNKLPYVSVKKGEESLPVLFTCYNVKHKDTKERISFDDYKKLSPEERAEYNVYPSRMVYNVFNIDQTNMKETRPELYEKYQTEYNKNQEQQEGEFVDFAAVDAMVEKDLYDCPIKNVYQDRAYYDIARDEITVPTKEQFKNSEAYYGTLFHEMAHSTGSKDRFDRIKAFSSMSDPNYAREELVAELSAALLCSNYGMEKNLKADSASYLKYWLTSLKQDSSFIKTTLFDVKNATSFISSRVDVIDDRLKRDGLNADFSDIKRKNAREVNRSAAPSRAFTPEENREVKETQKEEVSARKVEQARFHR